MNSRPLPSGEISPSYASTNGRGRCATYQAVCGKRATLLGEARGCRSALGTEQADGMLSGQLFGPGGNTTLEYWIDGRRIRAAWKAPSRKRPCRSRPLPVDPSFFVSWRLHRIGSRIKRFLHRHHHGSMTTSRGQNEHRSRQLGSRLCGRSARVSAPMRDWSRSSVIFERFLPWSRVACAVAH
jgi:hypothetical protein